MWLCFLQELDEMSWIKGPRQLLSLGMYKITQDERISIVPPVRLMFGVNCKFYHQKSQDAKFRWVPFPTDIRGRAAGDSSFCLEEALIMFAATRLCEPVPNGTCPKRSTIRWKFFAMQLRLF